MFDKFAVEQRTRDSCNISIFSNCRFSGLDMDEKHLFVDCLFTKSEFTKVEADGLGLYRSDLDHFTISDSNLSSSKFNEVKMTDSGIYNSSLQFDDFSDAKLVNLKVKNTSFFKVKFNKTWFSHLNTEKVNFNGSNFTDAAFTNGSKLSETSMKGATLTNCDFTGTDLTGVDFSAGTHKELGKKEQVYKDAIVAGAKFSQTILTDAILPASLNNFSDDLKRIEDLSKGAKLIYDIMLLVCGLVIFSVVVPRETYYVPLMSKLEVQPHEFNLLLSVGLCGYYIYFHIIMKKVWEAIYRLSKVFPDGLTLKEKIFPWMVTFGVEELQESGLSMDIKKLYEAQPEAFLSVFFAWLLPVFTMFGALASTLLLVVLDLESFHCSSSILRVVAFGWMIFIGIDSYKRCKKILLGKEIPERKLIDVDNMKSVVMKFLWGKGYST